MKKFGERYNMGYYTVLIISNDENPTWDKRKMKQVEAAVKLCMGGYALPNNLQLGITAKQYHTDDKKFRALLKMVKK